jgi:hypothetical protein
VGKLRIEQQRKLRVLAQQHGMTPDELMRRLLAWYHAKADERTKHAIWQRAVEKN